MSAEREVPVVRVELSGIRRKFDGATGRTFWRSLDELAESPGFLDFLHREFPEQASELLDPAGRREFLRVMGASLALAGLTACTRQPTERIVPYVKAPEEIVPGRPLYFATAVTDGGYAKGVLAESHMGRPTKIEGNPDHPASLGSTDARGQAAILGLYDPDRSKTVVSYSEIRSWDVFLHELGAAVAEQKATGGAGLRVLTETVTSPTLAQQMRDLLEAYPEARWHQYEATARDNSRAGAVMAFGEPVETRYTLENADVILSLDADFLGAGPAAVRYIRDFASRRRIRGEKAEMSRLYVVESTVSVTGSNADHRIAVRPSEVEGIARAVAAGLGLAVEGGTKDHAELIGALVRDLKRRNGRAVVIAGDAQPPAVHALAHAINQALGAVGKTVVHTAPVEAEPVDQLESLKSLVADMHAGKVQLLIVLGGNPVFTAPSDVDVAYALEKVAMRVHLGLHEDETSERCHWHIPEAHSLETWSDARAYDGTVTIMQPLIAPLYGGKSAHEVVAALLSHAGKTSHDVVKDYWRGRLGAPGFERAWQRALHDGVVPDTALPPKSVTARLGDWVQGTTPPAAAGIEIAFRPDPSIGDGRDANNGWLQELPKPLTKLTWGNAVLMSPTMAETLGVAVGRTHDGRAEGSDLTADGSRTDVVEVQVRGRKGKVSGPAWVVPGHPDGVVTIHVGHGRTRVGRVGSGVGFNGYALQTSASPWSAAGAEVARTGAKQIVACTQDHWSMEGRDIIRATSLEEFERDPEAVQARGEAPPADLTLYPPFKYEGHAWGMSIDLNSCVGCNACITACQSENNIPVVGPEQVGRGREMHWIRVDRYYEGRPENPEVFHQPVVCQQCENAPCEVVCPVAATNHSDEGLNDMVYNRCVGTRYCSNNCPYKVRRFNFLLYQDWTTPSLKLMRNPDVTVRSRGVMEKCTYCVQRINKARIDAQTQDRAIRDGEIQTACQQACPAQAIVFGDINDKKSRVSQVKTSPRDYGLLAELNTRPRTTYLAAVRNYNPEIRRG
jgi:MoCo/4Fe-4S cofactor protein with predicted Tat translocation signal